MVRGRAGVGRRAAGLLVMAPAYMGTENHPDEDRKGEERQLSRISLRKYILASCE